MQWLLVPFVVVTGVLHALQTGTKTTLAKASGAPIVAALAVYLVGIVTLRAFAPLRGERLRGRQAW